MAGKYPETAKVGKLIPPDPSADPQAPPDPSILLGPIDPQDSQPTSQTKHTRPTRPTIPTRPIPRSPDLKVQMYIVYITLHYV